MNKYYLISISIILIFSCTENTKVPDSVELNTWQDTVSYSIGFDVGKNYLDRRLEYTTSEFNKGFMNNYTKDSSYALGASLASNLVLQEIEVTPEVLLKALQITSNTGSLVFTEDEMRNILRKFNNQLREESEKRAEMEAKRNEEEGKAFIDEYKNKYDDKVETESGIVYRILKEGYGDTPGAEDKVIVHYTGKLIDNTVFDSSIDGGEPMTLAVKSGIKGWQEALQLMPVGSKWEIVIPSELGYSNRRGMKIPPNSTLIFEVELLGIE